MKSCVCRTGTGRRVEECFAGGSTARLNRLAPSMALSRALIIRGGFRARRAARSVRNKRKRTPIQCFSGVPRKRGCVASWQYFGPAFAEARRYALISHIFVRTRISHRKHSQFFFHVSRHEKRGFPLRRRRVFREQRVDDGAEPRYVPDHVRGLRGARRRGRPRGVHPHRRAKRRVDAPLRRRRREEKEKATSVSPRPQRVGSAANA